jgi:histidinol-phosphatase (PHP family)
MWHGDYPFRLNRLTPASSILQLDDPEESLAALQPRHEAYLVAAKHLQRAYAPQICLLVGFEAEWLGTGREAAYTALVSRLATDPRVDYFIGSVHHVDGHPIDFDHAFYARAVQAIGGGDGEDAEEALFAAYYDRQYDMLSALRPKVVGHFDLVRLLSRDPNRDLKELPRVWDKAVRNLEFVAGYGGWLECNSSALRKGLMEPYPSKAVAQVRTLIPFSSCVFPP